MAISKAALENLEKRRTTARSGGGEDKLEARRKKGVMTARDRLTGREDLGTGALGTLGNVIWFVLAGWWLAIGHISAAIAYAITIIGIPFAWQHVKLAIASLFPVGKTVVSVDRIFTPVNGSAAPAPQPVRQIAQA